MVAVLYFHHSALLCSHSLKPRQDRNCIRRLLKLQYCCSFCNFQFSFVTLKKVCVFVFQDQKLREVLGFGKGDNVEGKLVTIVHGNDLVNISFLNFQAMQEDTAKVTVVTATRFR